MRIYLSHAGNYDYESELYEPIRRSDIAKQHQVFLPHESHNVDTNLKDILGDIDVLVAEVSYPSTGQGIEIARADVAGVPIVCFYRKGTSPSSSLRFVTDRVLPYTDTAELLSKIEQELRIE